MCAAFFTLLLIDRALPVMFATATLTANNPHLATVGIEEGFAAFFIRIFPGKFKEIYKALI